MPNEPPLAFPDMVRKRPGMYFGNVHDGGAFAQVFHELVSNGIDPFLRGELTRIEVCIEETGAITVSDDGPGISVRTHHGGRAFLEHVMTTSHVGPTADGHTPHAHAGLNGVGLAPICAVSETVDVRVSDSTATYEQSFSRGYATSALAAVQRKPRGTSVRVVLDPDIFPLISWDLAWMRLRLRELACLCPGLVLSLGAPGIREGPEVFGPSADVGALLGADSRGAILCAARDGALTGAVALRWRESSDAACEILSYCCLFSTVDGGSHVRAFERALVNAARKAAGLPSSHAWRADYERLSRGLRAIVSANVVDPHYRGPTKDALVSNEASSIITRAVESELPDALRARPALLESLRRRLGVIEGA